MGCNSSSEIDFIVLTHDVNQLKLEEIKMNFALRDRSYMMSFLGRGSDAV